MKRLIFFFLLINFLHLSAQFRVKAPLIPREVLFKAEQKHSFKLAPDGDIIYFQTSKSSNMIFAMPLYQEAEPMPFILPNGIEDWMPINKGLLLSYGNKLYYREVGGKMHPILLPEDYEVGSIRIINRKKN